jgi:threonine dehydrogenase-like Zn-dependent dehydrogenase
MLTKAVRLYGKNDLRLEEFELPAIKEDEILAHIISDSVCMSSYKCAIQGSEHKKVPAGIEKNPVMIGHEFCGELVEVGSKWRNRYKAGDRFSVQPALGIEDDPNKVIGYSFGYVGGSATYVILPGVVMEQGCLLPYKGEAFFSGSLAEPMSCIIGAYHAMYHNIRGAYGHEMGIKQGGNMAILAGAGPMGLGAVDYALHGDRRPARLVVTDIDNARLGRAEAIYSREEAKRNGVDLIYANTSGPDGGFAYLMGLTGGKGYDDVLVFAPVKSVAETGDRLLARDGCLNFFAGPSNAGFSAEVNLYNVHYNLTHIMGTTGGNTDDMAEALDMMGKGLLNPASMITHVGGLNCAAETVLNLPKLSGGKKLVYTNIDMELTAIESFREKGRSDPMFAELADITARNNGRTF